MRRLTNLALTRLSLICSPKHYSWLHLSTIIWLLCSHSTAISVVRSEGRLADHTMFTVTYHTIYTTLYFALHTSYFVLRTSYTEQKACSNFVENNREYPIRTDVG